MSQHESTNNKANICIVGAGATGLFAVSSMVGQIQAVTCIGLEFGPPETTLPDSLLKINIADVGDYRDGNLATLMTIIATADLVFLLACLDDIPAVLLRHLRTTERQRSISMFLVTPEPAEETDRRSMVSIIRDGRRFVYEVPTPASASGVGNYLDGIIVASREALLQRESTTTEVRDSPAFTNYLLRYPVEWISNLVNHDQAGFISVSCDDIYKVLHRGVTRFGTGIASGPNRAILATEKAVSCLKQQQVKLADIAGIICIIAGSTAMTMDEYAAVSSYLFSLTDDNADVVVGVICDDSQVDNLLVTIMAKEKYSGHLLVPDHPNIARWVTNTTEDMRSIPAFERKKWFLDANESK